MRALVMSLAVLAGCAATPTGPGREVAVGWWSFRGIGDTGVDHVFQVMVLPARNGVQGARIKGIVGSAGIARIRPIGEDSIEELAVAPVIPGDQAPAIFRWEVAGIDLARRPMAAVIAVVMPRLPAQADPGNPLERARVDELALEAHADIEFASGRRAFAKGDAPLEEPVFLDDPYRRHTLRDGPPDPLAGARDTPPRKR